MGVVATPKSKDEAYWAHRERKEFEGSVQKCFDHHAFYVSYNLTSAFYNAMKEAQGYGGIPQKKITTITFPTMQKNVPSQNHLSSIK